MAFQFLVDMFTENIVNGAGITRYKDLENYSVYAILTFCLHKEFISALSSV